MPDIVRNMRKAYTDENPSSPLGRTHYKLGITQAPEHTKRTLPDHYNIPQFELLVVDPEYLFASWEIPVSQLKRAETSLGSVAFSKRQLVIRLRDENNDRCISAHQELYGEQGRWFFQHQLAGRWVTGELGFSSDQQFCLLNSAGPLCIPRNFVVEPDTFTELSIRYSTGPTGELIINRIDSTVDVTWPDKLTKGGILTSPSQGHRPSGSPDAFPTGIPSSPGPGLPSSPWSGTIGTASNNPADTRRSNTDIHPGDNE